MNLRKFLRKFKKLPNMYYRLKKLYEAEHKLFDYDTFMGERYKDDRVQKVIELFYTNHYIQFESDLGTRYIVIGRRNYRNDPLGFYMVYSYVDEEGLQDIFKVECNEDGIIKVAPNLATSTLTKEQINLAIYEYEQYIYKVYEQYLKNEEIHKQESKALCDL